MRRIRIAYLIDRIWTDTGGTERQLLETIRRLDRRRFEPQLICLYETEWTRRNPLPCCASFLGYRGFLHWTLLKVLARLARLIELHDFDIVQTFFDESIFLCYLATLVCRRRPVLISSRRDLGLGQDHPWYHQLMRALLPAINRRFDGILTNANAIRQHVIRAEGVPPAKVVVIPNGIDPHCQPAPAPELFRQFPAPLWIGITANLSPVKRIDVFLEALALLRDRHGVKEFRALVMGEGPAEPKLRAMAQKEGLTSNVHFAGAVPDVSPYLQHLDIAVLCSQSEGLSNAVLEYMKFSLPAVVTRVGGNPELVDDSNGICVPEGNSSALAQALATLAADPALRSRLGAAGRERLLRHYSWDACLKALQEYYAAMVRHRGQVPPLPQVATFTPGAVGSPHTYE